MSTEVGSIHYDLNLDTSKFQNQADNVGKKLSTVGKAVAVGMVAAGAAAVAFGVSAVKAYNEAEVAQKQLEHAVIDVSHATKEQLAQTSKLADELERKGVLDGDNIKMGLAQLSTFGLSNKAVQGLGGSLADLAVNQFGVNASGEQLSQTANMIAKALNGQFGVLEKSGIRFTEAQKSIIQFGTEEQKVKAINEGFAQNLKFTNEVAKNTAAGGMARLKVAVGNMQEKFGELLSKSIGPFIVKMSEVLSKVDWDKIIDTIKLFFQSFKAGDNLSEAPGIMNTIGAVAEKLRVIFNNAFTVIKQAIDFLMPSLMALWNRLETQLIPTLMRLWQQVIVPLAPAVGVVLVGALWVAINVLNVVWNVVYKVINIFITLFTFVTVTLPNGISTAFTWIVAKANWLRDNFWSVVGQVVGFFATLPIKLPFLVAGAIYKIIGFIWSINWGSVFSGIWSGMRWVWDRVWDTVIGVWWRIKGINWGDLAWSIGKGFVNAIIGIIEGALRGALRGLPGNVESKINFPRFARGTGYAPGGMALVGERGPELVNLPRGSQVFSNNDSKQMTGVGGGVNINIGEIHNEQDESYVMRRIDRNFNLAGYGISPIL